MLMPVDIKFSLPELRDGITAAKESKVYTPLASMTGCTEWVWHLAKAYVNVQAQRASGTHWLNTHAVMMEPCFVIASSPPTSRLDI